jgi:hypothetical protein
MTHQVPSEQGRVDSLLLAGSGHAVQDLHVLVIELDNLEVVGDTCGMWGCRISSNPRTQSNMSLRNSRSGVTDLGRTTTPRLTW